MTHVFVAPLALLLERFLGYSPRLVDSIGHPVIWFGKLISFLEKRTNTPEKSPELRRIWGVINLLILLAAVLLGALLLQALTRAIPFGFLLESLLATSLLAQKELGRAVGAVATALRQSLPAAREAVSHVVGRDPNRLDEAGVARAAVETLAESTSDGVVAPWFWLVLFGLPGIALYKAINTADSMIGHRNERYENYGWAAARLDDLVNLIPARLTALMIVLACFFVGEASPSKCWEAVKRDAKKHQSPNSGWPEAAFAGALGLALGGPRSYDGQIIDLPTMGNGRSTLGAHDITHALGLYRMTLNILLVLSVFLAITLSLSA